MTTQQHMRRLMGPWETQRYLLQRHGIKRTQGCVCGWIRRGYILPVASQRSAGHGVRRWTTVEQVDLAVLDGRIPRGFGADLTREDKRNEVTVQLMDELGLTLAEEGEAEENK